MKRGILKWGLVVVLICALMGGVAVAVNAGSSTPTLQVTGNSGVAPGMLTVAGKNWTALVEVQIYLDNGPTSPPGAVGKPDLSPMVAVVTPGANGAFVKSFPLGTTFLGTHTVQAVQNLRQATASFVITATDSNWYYYAYMAETVTDIEDTLDEVDHELENIVKADSDYEHFSAYGLYDRVIGCEYDTVRHVSLTLKAHGLEAGDYLSINIHFHGGIDAPAELLGNGESDELARITADGTYVYQFDAEEWYANLEIAQRLSETYNVLIAWNITTYEPAREYK
jgi:hypothetical protein